MASTDGLDVKLRDSGRRALAVGVLGWAIFLLGGLFSPEQFFRSYLFAYVLWTGIALGCMAIIMIHHLVGGGWGFMIQRLLESGTRTLPLMALLYLPILLGLTELYLWARPEAVVHDHALQHKSAYLNVSFFVLRTASYFFIWLGLSYFLNRWSALQDRSRETAWTERLRRVSGPGLVLYGLTVTFASIDWVMSLEPHWFSAIYGMLFAVEQMLAALALAIAVLAVLARYEPLASHVRARHFQDLGSLLFAFILIWAYLAFSQFLIIWSGNLPEEIPWYTNRIHGGWQWIGMILVVFAFFVPFLLLLSRAMKTSRAILLAVASGIVVLRVVDLFWLIAPAFHPAELRIHWMDLAAPIAMGGLWLAVFTWQLRRVSLLPFHDPRLQRILDHE